MSILAGAILADFIGDEFTPFPAVTTAAAERADTVPGADPHFTGRGD